MNAGWARMLKWHLNLTDSFFRNKTARTINFGLSDTLLLRTVPIPLKDDEGTLFLQSLSLNSCTQ
jgi:hypothetical protein